MKTIRNFKIFLRFLLQLIQIKLIMKTKFNVFLTLMMVFFVQFIFAQDRTVSGVVSDNSGLPLPGVNVLVKGTKSGVQTDMDGKFSIKANADQTLVFSFLGFTTQEVAAKNTSINVKLKDSAIELEGVVVTALGVKKEKKALGYASQQLDGADINDVPLTNFANALSGEVAGLNVQSFGTMGGSANINIRGFNSISGSNQALIVIDGTPVINSTSNTSDNRTGRGGYDYGNAAMDINPDDIASLNVLKGAGATALYGSRGTNGVILITTKKGKSKKGIGFSFSSSLTAGSVDKKTLPVYQDKYGAGYGPFYGASEDQYFNDQFDINGDGNNDLSVPFTEDASYGAAFDPNLLVYQWTSIYPQLPGYRKATPWVAGKNNPNSVFETALTTNNTLSFSNGNEKGSIRLSYTNQSQEGVLPNSSIKKNVLSIAGSKKITEKLTFSMDANLTTSEAKGRYGSGYDSNNPMQAFRQWWQTNVDLMEQKDAYFSTGGQNITWNASAWDDLSPIYTDNFYWVRYRNYQSDSRDRLMGNATLSYKINSWINAVGKISLDTYKEKREERTEVGSSNVSGYRLFNQRVKETNYDFMLNFDKNLTTDLNINGLVGVNYRIENRHSIDAETNGGLVVPGVFELYNSVNPLTQGSDVIPYDATKKVDGYFAKAGLGYKGTYYLDGTFRRDRSSALPLANNTYFYPSVTSSVIISNLLKKDWLSFGKVRASYGEVGNDTDPYQVFTTYGKAPNFNGQPIFSNNSVFNNSELKEERSKDVEFGVELSFLKNRIGIDLSYYDRKTIDLITPISVTSATGASNVWLNGADMKKSGWEFLFNATPLKNDNFRWDIKVNFGTYKSEVTRIDQGLEFIQLASVQGGVTLGAQLGEPFGVIRGRDYVYHENGQPIVVQTGSFKGSYLRSAESNKVIGDINPDWTGGVKNTFKYKNINFSFLIDVKKGGDVFSLDTWYGYATGLYDFTAGTNHLGNPVRNSVANGGGVLFPGVAPDGSPNTAVGSAQFYNNPWGYARAPQAQHVYDASFVKLREVSLTYNFSSNIAKMLKLQNVSLSAIGRNLWIIDKNTPYADPEAGLSAGNIQGYQSGSYPSVKEIGASLKIEF